MERPRYFPRQLMTPTELILEQDYFRDKMRRHNRLLHGYGVICGAWVSRVPAESDTAQPQPTPAEMAKMKAAGAATQADDPWFVRVSPGVLLSPQGDEIVIACDQIVDVRDFCQEVTSDEPCLPTPDPWHSEASVARPNGPVFVAVRYKEIAARPVRVQPSGCGCDESECEYSIWKDGFEICMLPECPPSHQVEQQDTSASVMSVDCLLWPEDSWVVLAQIDLGPNGITAVDNTACRRFVPSLATGYYPGRAPAKDRTALLDAARKTIVEYTDIKEADLVNASDVLGVPDRPGVTLKDVTPKSYLGKQLADQSWTIKDIARTPQEIFARVVSHDAEKNQRNSVHEQARKVWDSAVKVMKAVEELESVAGKGY
jgi:hypothetical protein